MFLLKRLANFLFGAITASLIVFATVTVQQKFNCNLLNAYVFFAIPLGAIILGVISTSGFLLGTRLFHIPVSFSLIAQIIAVALASYGLIYFLDYNLLQIDGRYLKDSLTFSEYFVFMSTQSFYSISSSIGFELGKWGYLLNALEVMGFVFASLICVGMLPSQPYCESCQRFMVSDITFAKLFNCPEKILDDAAQLSQLEVGSIEFIENLCAPGDLEEHEEPQDGTLKFERDLFECEKCDNQKIASSIHIYNGQEWEEQDDLTEMMDVPFNLEFNANASV